MERIRRTRPAPVVQSTPSRVRRTRPPSAVQEVGRVRRVRQPPPSVPEGTRPYFYIDWSRSLRWKLQIYMVTSYLYYIRHKSLITDHEFDRLCKEIAEGWDTFEHQHKHCTDRESMVAATGYACEYPNMVIGAAEHMLRHYAER